MMPGKLNLATASGLKFATTSFLLASLLLAGCATSSTIESRKRARPEAYQILTPEMRDAVDHGQIKFGMSQDAVHIAWGKPDQILRSGDQTGETVTWLYQGTYLQETRFWGRYEMHYAYTPIPYTRAQVVFMNGVVKDWHTYTTPNAY